MVLAKIKRMFGFLGPGAFFVLACLTALQNVMKKKALEKGDVKKAEKIGCGTNCAECGKKETCGNLK